MNGAKGLYDPFNVFRAPSIETIDIDSEIGCAMSNHGQAPDQNEPDVRFDQTTQDSFKVRGV
jgi:hypothetical protein